MATSMRPALARAASTARSTEASSVTSSSRMYIGSDFLFRKHTDLGSILGVAASGVTHRRKNGVPFPSQSIGEQSAKAGAGTGDENHLLGIHGHLLVVISCSHTEREAARTHPAAIALR